MVTFCGECFCFGYTKLYQDFCDYNGFDEKIGDYGDLASVYCPACQNEKLIEAGLNKELEKVLRLEELADEISITLTQAIGWADDYSTAKEYSIAVLIFAAAGLCSLKTKRFTSSGWSEESYEDCGKAEAKELLEKATIKDVKAVLNSIKLLSKTEAWGKVKNVASWIESEIQKHPEILIDLV